MTDGPSSEHVAAGKNRKLARSICLGFHIRRKLCKKKSSLFARKGQRMPTATSNIGTLLAVVHCPATAIDVRQYASTPRVTPFATLFAPVAAEVLSQAYDDARMVER